MKFDVIKFRNNTGDGGCFDDWSEDLKQMNEVLKTLPTYNNGGEYWTFWISKNRWIDIGFYSDGSLYCKYFGRVYKDINKPVMNMEEINKTTELYLNVINIFDNFGYIIHTPPTRKGRMIE
jgi:hypothetical protein